MNDNQSWDENLFQKIREQALDLWEKGTQRDCTSVNDDMTGSFECKWQDRAVLELNYEHISIFCSLGEWANNISDILKDCSNDYYDFLYEDHCQALFRYYTRFLLVVSELLNDFEEIVEKAKSVGQREARKLLSTSGKRDEITDIFAFINTVCKHKVGNIHLCNHHLPIWFEDCRQSHPFNNPITLKDRNFKNDPDGILIPKLNYFIQVILNCYAQLDNLFEAEAHKFEIICNEYNEIKSESRVIISRPTSEQAT